MLAAGARHAAAIDDPARAVTRLLLAEASWASSATWRARIQQLLYDGFVGFGCRVAVEAVPNAFVKVGARLVLRDASMLADTSEVAENAASALRRYFDERPDWYTYRLGAVRAVLARCDARVTESFNVVTADGIAAGVPSVVSEAIDWAPKRWQANADDAGDVARVAEYLLKNPHAVDDGRDALRDYVSSALVRWRTFLEPSSLT
jgi:hypothetical protein